MLKDFLSRRYSPPRVPRFQSPPSTPFNSASDAFQLHPDVRSYGPSTLKWYQKAEEEHQHARKGVIKEGRKHIKEVKAERAKLKAGKR